MASAICLPQDHPHQWETYSANFKLNYLIFTCFLILQVVFALQVLWQLYHHGGRPLHLSSADTSDLAIESWSKSAMVPWFW